MSDRFREVRETEFPWTRDRIYLNSAGTGPLPERTRRVADEWNRRRQTPDAISDQELFDTQASSRRLSAALIGAHPDEIACATNTSFGINIAAHGLRFERGDTVLFSQNEFPANAYPWLALRQRGVNVEMVPVTAAGWPDEEAILRRLESTRVRLVAVSFVQSSTGYTVDLARLSAATRATGTVLVVDAIQGVGTVPLDVGQIEIDVLACGAQKWLLSPWGTGFVYIRRAMIDQIESPMTGWMAYEGTEDFTRLTNYSDTLHNDARRFEVVTLPYHDFAAMNVSLALMLDIGIPAIAEHIALCHAPVLAWAESRSVRVTSPRDHHGSALLCIAPPDPAASLAALRAGGVYCTMREGSLRLSPHLFNSVGEMERAVQILDQNL